MADRARRSQQRGSRKQSRALRTLRQPGRLPSRIKRYAQPSLPPRSRLARSHGHDGGRHGRRRVLRRESLGHHRRDPAQVRHHVDQVAPVRHRAPEEHPVVGDAVVDHPFNSVGPHECIKFLEFQIYTGGKIPDLDKLPDPRLFATHVPFVALPRTITAASCKIVYVCRDPKDTMISWWHFINKFRARDGMDPLPAETAAELFCDGVSGFGPYWDHVLGYWRAHLAHPEQVLFFRYEEMQRDTAAHVRRLAEFVGLPFGAGREEDAVVDAIVRLCSFKHMSGLKATKGGKTDTSGGALENNSFFRRGMVGDWANHLLPETARRIDAITEAKFKGSGLSV